MALTFICTDIHCKSRLGCVKFLNALEVNVGHIKYNYYEIKKCDYEPYKKRTDRL